MSKQAILRNPQRRAGPGHTRNQGRPVFRDILEQTREQAAGAAWDRAKLASSLRHLATSSHQSRAARKLAGVKERSLARATSLLPDRIQVRTDHDWRVGFLSIRWEGHGRLHLPPEVLNKEHAIAATCAAE